MFISMWENVSFQKLKSKKEDTKEEEMENILSFMTQTYVRKK